MAAYNRNTDFMENMTDLSIGMMDVSADTGFDRNAKNDTGYKSSFNRVVNGNAQSGQSVEVQQRQERIQRIQQEIQHEKPTEKLNTSATAHAAVHGSPETIARVETAKADRRSELKQLVAENAEEVAPAAPTAQPQQKGAAMDTIINEVKTSPIQTAAAAVAGAGVTAATGSIELGAATAKGIMALNAGQSALNIGGSLFSGGEGAGDTDTDSFNFDTPTVDLGALTLDSMFLRDKSNNITLFAGMGMEDALQHLGEDAWEIKERLQNLADYEDRFDEGLNMGRSGTNIAVENPTMPV